MGYIKKEINHNRPSPRLVTLGVDSSKLRSSAPKDHFHLHGVNHNVPSPTAVAVLTQFLGIVCFL